MARQIEVPLEVATDHDRTRITHPAFGQIGASRVSGRANLYGSDFSHHNYVTITLSKSEVDRHLSNDWHHAKAELFEVALSEAQWATFVSSMNVGMGVPCTIQHLGRSGYVPGLPDPPDRRDTFAKEMQANNADANRQLEELERMILNSGLSRKKIDEMLSASGKAKREIGSSSKFVADQFDEHMEKTVERAKIEVNAYATRMIMATGLNTLGVEAPITLGIAHEEDM